MAIPILDLGFDYGATGGPTFVTDISVSAGGYEQRRNYQSRPLGSWQLGERLVTSETLDKLISFFNAMRGRHGRFKYKDWNDYTATRFANAIPGAFGVGKIVNATTIQLYKRYYAASGGVYIDRKIYHPIASSVKVWINGTLETGTVNEDTGQVTNPAWNLIASDVIEAAFEFYVPARFDTDEFQATFENMEDGVAVYFISNLKVKEVIPV